MDEDHTFVASGEACPTCLSLDGTGVPAGFTAHENCLCRTVPKAKDTRCESVSDNVDFAPSGPGGKLVMASYEVTVKCPKGGLASASGYVEVDPVVDNPVEALWDAVGALADELCESCADEEDDPFLCC
jgi:hypothetical protein